MTVSLKHAFQSAVSDGGDASLVRPSNWNAEHDLTLATARLLGRTTAGDGGAEEIAVFPPTAFTGGRLEVAALGHAYRSGRVYGPIMPTNAGGSPVANTLYLSPLVVFQRVTVSGIALYKTANNTVTARVGIYNADTNALVAESTLDVSLNTGTAIEIGLGGDEQLDAGRYFLGVVFSGTAPNMATFNAGAPAAGHLGIYVGGANAQQMAVATGGVTPDRIIQTAGVTYSAGSPFLPDPLGALTIDDGTPGSPWLGIVVV